jgi:hypothetical protein
MLFQLSAHATFDRVANALAMIVNAPKSIAHET